MTGNSKLLDGIAIFKSVVDSGGFSAAARRLGHSTSHISKVVGQLETRLGVRLLNRTTRSINLTDEGQNFYRHSLTIIEIAEEATRAATDQQDHPCGVLRVSAPVSFGLTHLSHHLPKFMQLYPDVKLDIDLNDRLVDVISEGYDLAIRVGHLSDSSLIAKKLCELRGVVVAAPSFWGEHGRPEHPSELSNYTSLTYSNLKTPSQWTFTGKDGGLIKVDLEWVLSCNSAEMTTALAVAGIALGRLPSYVCQPEIDRGELEVVLSDFEDGPLGIYALYPHRALLSSKVRAFVGFLSDTMG